MNPLAIYTTAPKELIRGRRALIPIATKVQLVPHVVYPFDPAVLRAIRSFDPSIQPAWIAKVYRSPSGAEVINGYHAIASHSWDPGSPVALWAYQCLLPTMGKFERPTSIHLHLRHKDESGRAIPGTFVPFDWRIYNGLLSAKQEMSPQDKQRYLEQHGEVAQRRREREMAEREAQDREQQDARWLRSQMDQITDEDARRFGARLAAGQPLGSEPKPFVQVPA